MRKSVFKGVAMAIALHSAAPLFSAPVSSPNDYVRSHSSLATYESLRSNIPASIIMAQAIFESNWGQSTLAIRSNNHFGVKANNWSGAVEYAKDDDYDQQGRLVASPFRKYATVEESYADHTNFLLTYDRYRPLFHYDRTNYSDWANGLSKCGYATDKAYARKLIQLIESYQLYKLDVPQTLFTDMSLQNYLTTTSTTKITPSTEAYNQPATHANTAARVSDTQDGTLFEITADIASPNASSSDAATKGVSAPVRKASDYEFYEISTNTGTLQSSTRRTITTTKTSSNNSQNKNYRME